MEDKIIDLEQLQKNIEDATKAELSKADNIEATQDDPAEDIPRNADGSPNMDLIALGKDDKGRYIVPDDIFDKYYKELPRGTGNESKTYKAYNGGKIKTLTPEDRAIQIEGARATNAKLAQRRTFKDTINYMLKQKPNKRVIEDLQLTEDATNLDAIIAAALMQAGRGNVKAMDFLRDTVGEKPSEKLDATVQSLTEEDKIMLENIKARLDS